MCSVIFETALAPRSSARGFRQGARKTNYGPGSSMADEILFLTELLGLKVYDLKGRRIGVVKDAAIVPLVDPVRIDRYLIGSGAAWLNIRHDQVKSISLDGIHLRDENLTPYHSDEYLLRVERD